VNRKIYFAGGTTAVPEGEIFVVETMPLIKNAISRFSVDRSVRFDGYDSSGDIC